MIKMIKVMYLEVYEISVIRRTTTDDKDDTQRTKRVDEGSLAFMENETTNSNFFIVDKPFVFCSMKLSRFVLVTFRC